MNSAVKELFLGIEDPRIDRAKKHPLESILYIVLCGTIAGIESWIGFQDYAEAHEEALSKFIDLPNGVPSHDTIGRVISSLNVEEFMSRFEGFAQEPAERVKGVIAIDGKTIRRSFDKEKKVKPRHIVSAWSDCCKLVLGQVKTDSKSNEITAIPELLARIDIKNQIITIDAMGCQRNICSQIIRDEADYVIAVKGNQGCLFEDIKLYFDQENPAVEFKEWEERDKGHGRIEHRFCQATSEIEWLQGEHSWPGLKSIARVESTRTVKGQIQSEVRFYISSLGANPERIAKAARAHWGIENSLHWVLDVDLHEDSSRIRTDNAPEILSLMKKTAINLINRVKGTISIRRMLRKVAMSPAELLRVLQGI